MGLAGRAALTAYLQTLDSYRPTPLISLPGLAAENGVALIHIKDEGQRLGLRSFKALGGAYAVLRAVRSHLRSHGLDAVSTRIGSLILRAAFLCA